MSTEIIELSDSDTSPKRPRFPLKKSQKQEIKLARLKGEGYVNTRGNFIAKKEPGPECGCRNKCTQEFSSIERKSFIETVYNGRPKNEQDSYLMSFIKKVKIGRRRPRYKDTIVHRSATFHYFAPKNDTTMRICKRAFCSLFAVSDKVVSRLSTLVATNKQPEDLRGKYKRRQIIEILIP